MTTERRQVAKEFQYTVWQYAITGRWIVSDECGRLFDHPDGFATKAEAVAAMIAAIDHGLAYAAATAEGEQSQSLTSLRSRYKLQVRYDVARGCMVVDSTLGILANVASYLAGDHFITDWIAKKQSKSTPKKRRATKSPRRTCHCPNCNPYNYDEPHGAFYCVASGDFSAFNAGVPLGCFESKIAAETAINASRYDMLKRAA